MIPMMMIDQQISSNISGLLAGPDKPAISLLSLSSHLRKTTSCGLNVVLRFIPYQSIYKIAFFPVNSRERCVSVW